MNIYDDFFKGITPDDWELFAEDFFSHMGFDIITAPSIGADGGIDLKVSYKDKTYLVSCKHFINSGNSVKPSDEQNILDRVGHHNTDGFIGFYSTQISSGLSDRLENLNKTHKPRYSFSYIDKSKISEVIPKMPFTTLQKYGLCNGLAYVLNVPESRYKPLGCLNCGKDILDPQNIPYSIIGLYVNKSEELEYLYGCKSCLPAITPFAEVSQVLHLEWLQGWSEVVEDYVEDYNLSEHFYTCKSNFDTKILQRVYPQNLGTWI